MALRRLLPLFVAGCATGRPGVGDDLSTWDGWTEADPTTSASTTVRIATWNVEALGDVGEDQYVAVEQILARLDADVVVLQEIADSADAALAALADSLGYPTFGKADFVPYGSIGCAAMSRLDGVTVAFPTAPELSGDPDADDVTRLPAVVTVPLADTGLVLSFTGTHLKSGDAPADAFRRSVDAVRTAQAAAAVGADVVLVAGDPNDDVVDVDPSGAPWLAPPADIPVTYALGQDLVDRLARGGIPKDLFLAFEEIGLEPLEAHQRDGSRATRPESGRRIDYVLGDAAARGGSWRAEVYDPADEGLPGVADGGGPLAADTAARASDHLPIVGELRVSAP